MRWNVVGHEEQKTYLTRHLEAGTLPHALLLEGQSGIGKRLLANDVATFLLSDSILPPEGNPDCMHLAPGVDQETGKQRDIDIATIRERLRPWAYLKPAHGVHKVVIIDDCDRMGDDAANALLKVLEEPPAYLTFLLITGRSGCVLETIASRCQHVALHPLSVEQMHEILRSQKLDADDRALVSMVAAGRPGVALSLIRDKRLPDVATSIAAFERSLEGGVAERLILSREVAESDDPEEIVTWWLAFVRSRCAQRPSLVRVAHGLLDLAPVLREPHYNRRLALERFWLSVD